MSNITFWIAWLLWLLIIVSTCDAASAQSSSPGVIFEGGNVCVWMPSAGMRCLALSPKVRENMARAKAIRECRAYGSCGQQRSR